MLYTSNLAGLFHLPLSQQALCQFQWLQQECQNIQSSENNDKWCVKTGSATSYSSAKVYKELIIHQNVHPVFKWLWKSKCQPKHKVFGWLLLKDRLSTRNLLRRRNMALDNHNCVLCQLNVEETTLHLFLDCTFAQECWHWIEISIRNNQTFQDLATDLRANHQT